MARKLQYYDFNGYAEPIRYILHYGGLEFEDIRYNYSEWPIKSVKESLPYGQLPVYEENGRVLNQSLAITKYVAAQVGLQPSNAWEQAKQDAAALNVYDLFNKIRPYVMEKDAIKKEEIKQSVDESVAFYLSRFEKELAANNGHFGDKLYWADFVLVNAIEGFKTSLGDLLRLENYPNISALVTKVQSLPGIKEYLAKKK